MRMTKFLLPAAAAAMLLNLTGYAHEHSKVSFEKDCSESSSSSRPSRSSSSSSPCSSSSSMRQSSSSNSEPSCSSSSSSPSCSSSSSSPSSSSSSCSSSPSSSSHHEPVCKPRFNNLIDPLIGIFGVENCHETDYGVISFQAGGTLIAQDTYSLGQSTHAHPDGTVSTVSLGQWKKIKQYHYRFFFTKVVSVRDHDSHHLTTKPCHRVRIEGELVLNRDKKCFEVCAKLTRWKLEDINCNSMPLHDHHGKKHSEDDVTFSGKRIDFLK